MAIDFSLRRPYISSLPYLTQMRNVTFAGMQANARKKGRKVARQSVLAKPYLNSGTYSEMEYWMPRFPGLPNMPIASQASPDGMVLEPPDSDWSLVFMCNWLDCYCPGQTTVIPLECSHRVVGVQVIDAPAGVSVEAVGAGISVTAPEGVHGSITVDVIMSAYVHNDDGSIREVRGRHFSMEIDECMEWECAQCDCTQGLAWDDATSADTVARSASCTVGITDTGTTCGPYSWSVSGTGFTLDNAVTVGLTNGLNADGSACGSATITVTGCDGITTVTGYVKCTTGLWCNTDGGSAWRDGGEGCGTGVRCPNLDPVDGGNVQWRFGRIWCEYLVTPAPYYWLDLDPAHTPPCGSPTECGGTAGASPCVGAGDYCCVTYAGGVACGQCILETVFYDEWKCSC